MKRTLILGGTAWLGQEIARQTIRRGHEVTCLARGESGEAPDGAILVRADRRARDAYSEVRDFDWDEVIELSCKPAFVTGALENIAERAKHWTLVSSISVYASNHESGATEDADLVVPTELGDYAQAKVAAEQASATALGERLLIARPGLIVGPGDTSDRFSYWVSRLALAKDETVLVPDTSERVVQFIDVRNLASWIVDAGNRGLTGTYNCVGSEYDFSFVLQTAAEVSNFSGELIVANDKWLLAHGVTYWAGPGSLPLWLPRGDEAFAQRSSNAYFASGGTERSLPETMEDILRDEQTHGLDRPRRSGLSRSEEVALLCKLKS